DTLDLQVYLQIFVSLI
ncbi:hypothetical protein CP03DC29_0677B, partial [Chlamydia psittaci 03DC29]